MSLSSLPPELIREIFFQANNLETIEKLLSTSKSMFSLIRNPHVTSVFVKKGSLHSVILECSKRGFTQIIKLLASMSVNFSLPKKSLSLALENCRKGTVFFFKEHFGVNISSYKYIDVILKKLKGSVIICQRFQIDIELRDIKFYIEVNRKQNRNQLLKKLRIWYLILETLPKQKNYSAILSCFAGIRRATCNSNVLDLNAAAAGNNDYLVDKIMEWGVEPNFESVMQSLQLGYNIEIFVIYLEYFGSLLKVPSRQTEAVWVLKKSNNVCYRN